MNQQPRQWARSVAPVSKPGPAKSHGPVSKTPPLPNLDFGEVSKLGRAVRVYAPIQAQNLAMVSAWLRGPSVAQDVGPGKVRE
jgi:hypothetical protein